MNRVKKEWKQPVRLLTAIGIANIGAWIHLIALNLMVLELTNGSPAAVAVLYMLKPLAALCTNGWSGSVIDRVDRQKLLVRLDLFRAVLLAGLLLHTELPAIYAAVFLAGMAEAVFEPASLSYITNLIRPEQRKPFNAFRSLISSGAFIIGPAAAGLLFMAGTPEAAIAVNAAALMISAWLIKGLPRAARERKEAFPKKLSSRLIREDWRQVRQFSRQHPTVAAVCLLFSALVVLMTAVDSLEAAFAVAVLQLTEQEYGLLVSCAGAGIAAGSLAAAAAKRISEIRFLQGGSAAVASGYLIYACSDAFMPAAAGFFTLAFALAFVNTGFHTFCQEKIPSALMGRFFSLLGLAESAGIIVLTLLFGAAAQGVSIRTAVAAGTVLMLAVSCALGLLLFYMGQKEVSRPLKL